MAISVQCRGCGKVHTVPDDWAGKNAKCNECGAETQIPTPGMTPVDVTPLELRPTDVVPAGPVPVPPVPILPVSGPPAWTAGSSVSAGPAGAVPVVFAPTAPPSRMSGFPEAQAAADRESARRTGHLVMLGFLLFLAFILPMAVAIGRDIQFDFMSLRGFASGDMPLLTRIELLYPLIAGVIVTVLGSAWEHRGRGVALLVLAALPFVVDAARPGHRESVRSVASLLVVATVFFVISSRARFYRPRWGVLYWVGLVAAGLFVAALLVPGKLIGAFEGQSVYRFFTEDFFSGAFSAAPGELQGLMIAGLIMLVLFAIAIILALCNVPRTSGGAPAGMAQLSGAFVVLGALVLAALILVLQTMEFKARALGQTGIPFAVNQTKLLVLYGGYLLVGIAGVVDLIIGPARSHHVGRAGP